MGNEQDINYRRVPWLGPLLRTMERRILSQTVRVSDISAICNNRKYHVASKRTTAVLLLGGTVDQTLTWSAPFDNTDYIVEWALFDLEGQATITELSRTTTTIQVRLTGTVATLALGACYMAFGRSI